MSSSRVGSHTPTTLLISRWLAAMSSDPSKASWACWPAESMLLMTIEPAALLVSIIAIKTIDVPIPASARLFQLDPTFIERLLFGLRPYLPYLASFNGSLQ